MVILIALLPTVFVMTFGIGWAMGWSSTRIWEQLQFPVIKCWLILALPLALIHRLRFPLYASWCDATPSKTKEGHPIIIIWFRNQRFAKAWLDSWEDPIEIPT